MAVASLGEVKSMINTMRAGMPPGYTAKLPVVIGSRALCHHLHQLWSGFDSVYREPKDWDIYIEAEPMFAFLKSIADKTLLKILKAQVYVPNTIMKLHVTLDGTSIEFVIVNPFSEKARRHDFVAVELYNLVHRLKNERSSTITFPHEHLKRRQSRFLLQCAPLDVLYVLKKIGSRFPLHVQKTKEDVQFLEENFGFTLKSLRPSVSGFGNLFHQELEARHHSQYRENSWTSTVDQSHVDDHYYTMVYIVAKTTGLPPNLVEFEIGTFIKEEYYPQPPSSSSSSSSSYDIPPYNEREHGSYGAYACRYYGTMM